MPIPTEEGPLDLKGNVNGHTYRAGIRASFLYPSWLASKVDSKQTMMVWARLKVLQMRIAFYKIFEKQSDKQCAQENYLGCLALEQKLRQQAKNIHTWQKNLLHELRQQQLSYFEMILKSFIKTQGNLELELHPFPEIILVMAQTLVENPAQSPDMVDKAKKLLESYNLLRHYIFVKSQVWWPQPIKLHEADPCISCLLHFYEAWKEFKYHRSLLIKISDSVDEKLRRIKESISYGSKPSIDP